VEGVGISISPDPVKQNEIVTVTVSMPGGSDPSGWLMRMVAAEGATKLPPRRLDAYGVPRQGNTDTYDCKVRTIKFEPGEYIVDLSPKASFDPLEAVSKKFAVVPHRIVVASVGMGGHDQDAVLLGTLCDRP